MLVPSLLLDRRFFAPEGEGGGGSGNAGGGDGANANPGGNGGGGANAGDGKPKVEFSAEQQAELNRLLAAEKRTARAAGRAEAEAERTAAEDAARQERERNEAAARGEFDRVRGELEAERDRVKGERDDVQGRLDKAMAVIGPQVEAAWKDLPAEVAGMYDGADDDVLAKAAFVEKTKALAARLAGGPTNKGNPPGPNPAGPIGGGGAELKPLVSKRQAGFG